MAKPTYRVTIDPEFSDGEDLGWAKTAFTNRPAIMVKGVSFSVDQPRKAMSFADKLKYRIAAPAMIPMEIYRNDEDGEYYVEFTAKEIEKIHKKFMKNLGKNKDLFNLEHDNSEIVPAYILEILLLDTQAKVDMVLSDYKIKVPVGTLFVIAQVTDKEYYNQLVENEQTGFSIEGFLGMSLQELEEKSKTNKKEEMKKEDLKLAEASILKEGDRFQIGDKSFIVKDGAIVEDVIEVEAAEDEKKEEVIEAAEDEKKEEEEVALEEAPADEVKEEELAEDAKEEVKEEELAEDKKEDEEVKEEEMAEGDEEAPASDSYSKEEVDAKLDEIYKMIADLHKSEVIEEDVIEEVALSVHDRLGAFAKFSKKK
jgi:hypothetical protein